LDEICQLAPIMKKLPSMVFFLFSFSALFFFCLFLTCPATSEGTSLYVLNARFVGAVAREEGAAAAAEPLATPTTPRCRSVDDDDDMDLADDDNDDDDTAKNDRAAEAREPCDASAAAWDALSAVLRVECCRSGRSCEGLWVEEKEIKGDEISVDPIKTNVGEAFSTRSSSSSPLLFFLSSLPAPRRQPRRQRAPAGAAS